MTDFPTALNIIQRNADPERIWETIQRVAGECDMMPCRFKEGDRNTFTWTDRDRVIHYSMNRDTTVISECDMVAFRYDVFQERTFCKPYLAVIYDDYKTIWNAIAELVDTTIDSGWFR